MLIFGGISGYNGRYDGTNKIYTKGNIEKCTNNGIVYGQGTTARQVGGISSGEQYGSTIKDCNNTAKVTCEGYNSTSYYWSMVGGIVGILNTVGDNIVDNCTNTGEVIGSYSYTGGIVGAAMKGAISNCTNNGSVTGKRYNTGGIAGALGIYSTTTPTVYKGTATMDNCKNLGEINSTFANVGGLTGGICNNSTITNSGNIGNITSNGKSSDNISRTGGIVGIITSSGTNKISYCYNTGNVNATYRGAGGIVGYLDGSNNFIQYVYSTGIVSAPTLAGGIVGYKTAGTVDTATNYYLNGCATVTSGSATELGTSTDSNTIKGIALLNVWKDYFKTNSSESINKGYPILNWE